MGKKKANIALANLILRICYHVLKQRTPYVELGDYYFTKREIDKEKRLIKELQKRGYIVQKEEQAI